MKKKKMCVMFFILILVLFIGTFNVRKTKNESFIQEKAGENVVLEIADNQKNPEGEEEKREGEYVVSQQNLSEEIVDLRLEKALENWKNLIIEVENEKTIIGENFFQDTGERMKKAFLALPDEKKEELVKEMMYRISDKNIGAILSVLYDESFDRDVLDIIFSDILNRDEDLKQPVIEKIGENKNHPLFDDADHILEVQKVANAE